MKFTCNQQVLSKALNTVSKAVTTRTTIPILKGILLEASEDGVLKMAASDLDLSIEKKINVNVSEPGALVISARLFSDIIRKLPNEEIEVEETEKNLIVIRCMTSEFTIVSQPADEFPNIGEINEDQKLSFDKGILREMIKMTSFSASIEESKGIIVGVLIELEEDYITLAALDGFRMAVAKEKMRSEETQKIIIAARILNEVNKIISESDDENPLSMIIDEKKAVFLMEDTRVVLRLLEGEFIKYKDIIPKDFQCSLTVRRGDLEESIERASLLAREGKNNLIKLAVEGDRMVITSRSEEGNVKEEISVSKEGSDLEIGFNSKYILDVVKAVTDDEIIMKFNTNVSPCIITPKEGEKFLYLVLPVRIAAG